MSSTIIQENTIPDSPRTNFVRKKRTMATVEDFENWQKTHHSDYNYEFYYGQKTKKQPMKQNEFFIVKFLSRLFIKTEAFFNGDELLAESDTYIDLLRKRVPDMAYFTLNQIFEAAKGAKVVPAFTIEILSDSESFTDVANKIKDYFDAGVQLVWYISPKHKSIYAYTSTKEIKVYEGTDCCEAKPVLPDFSFIVEDLFKIS